MISHEQIMAYTQSACLGLDDHGIATMTVQLEQLIEHLQNLVELNGGAQEPSCMAISSNLLRSDEICQGLSPRQLSALAPRQRSGYIVVPRMIGER